eukprot:2926860-Amphidinium_carterae.1
MYRHSHKDCWSNACNQRNPSKSSLSIAPDLSVSILSKCRLMLSALCWRQTADTATWQQEHNATGTLYEGTDKSHTGLDGRGPRHQVCQQDQTHNGSAKMSRCCA